MALWSASALVCSAWREGLMPDPDLTIDAWSDEFRYLPPTSSEPGLWRTSRTPYMRDIMLDLSPGSGIDEVVLVKSGQISGSETANNVIGYIIHLAPGPTMLVQPTVDAGKDYVRERINPLIEYTPVLKNRIAEAKSRKGGNTMRFKKFAGGFLSIAGANSAQGLQSRPIRYLILDEIDRYPRDVNGQGDPVGMAVKRTDTFQRNRKIFKLSTPGNKEESRIIVDYEETDQRRYFVPCPHCGHMDYIRWENIHWPKGEPEKAHLICTECGAVIEEHHKTAMLAAGEWRPTARSKRPGLRGYHVPGLLSPLGWRSWAGIARDWEQAEAAAARGDHSLKKKVTNLDLGEAYEEVGDQIAENVLKTRTESYEQRMVPYGAFIITAGIDIQHNRIECHAIAWGREEEAWVVDYLIIWGDPLLQKTWDELDAWLVQPFHHQSGVEMRVAAACIDAGDGHTSNEVYKFTRTRAHRSIMAIKGDSRYGGPVIKSPSAVDVDIDGQKIKEGARVWLIGTDTAKNTLYARLRLENPGKNYIHFGQWLADDYFNQLTSEKLVTKYLNGRSYKRWKKPPGARNEAWDTLVYAYAAAVRLGVNRWAEKKWEELEKRLLQPVPEPKTKAGEQKSEVQKQSVAPARRSSRSAYLG
ncbi:MAG: Phage terminase large subunit (GpA) [Betaproteobacteria bacterium ADurb.Bin341]|nr:MAG: Phage terminase large subunit (GpA) [Betaproteobacteria bacterium ADurb.Bin341]